jgi:hypothetical protein
MEDKKDVSSLAAMFGGSKSTATKTSIKREPLPSKLGAKKLDDPKPTLKKEE